MRKTMLARHAMVTAAATAATCCALAAGAGMAPPGSSALASIRSPGAVSPWGTARVIPGLPALSGGRGANVETVSCSSAGNCAVGGSYVDRNHLVQAFVASEQAGVWRPARQVPGTGAVNTGEAEVTSVSCPATGDCGAGGDYLAAIGDSQAYVVNEVNGSWHGQITVLGTVPTGSGPGSGVTSISCPAAGYCAAGGFLEDNDGNQLPFVVDERHGTWGAALPVALGGEVTAVSCASPGNCTAGGDYTASLPVTQVFVMSEKNGVWGQPRELPGIAALGSATANLAALSCTRTGSYCSAGGTYDDHLTRAQAFVASEKNGVWSNARQVAAGLNTGGNASVNAVSCASPGSCAAGGSYFTHSNRFGAFVIVEKNGIWQTAREVAAGAFSQGRNPAVNSVACPAAGDCIAGGVYNTSDFTTGAFVVIERNGTWQPTQVTATAADAAGISSISCPSVRSCTATGSAGRGFNGGFVATGSI
jgi:hypothetical protein